MNEENEILTRQLKEYKENEANAKDTAEQIYKVLESYGELVLQHLANVIYEKSIEGSKERISKTMQDDDDVQKDNPGDGGGVPFTVTFPCGWNDKDRDHK